MTRYGTVALIGSGETAFSGGQTFEALAKALPVPLRAAVLETPAGFEGNSARVAGRVAHFLCQRLQNYQPQVAVIPARKKGTPLSPDQPGVVEPLYDQDLIFLGPGSPSYAVRQLAGSLAWEIIQARHRLGASLTLASAATIAAGALALPVYEIYKVGEDPHWLPGLDFFKPFGLSLIIVPHWNNRDGGEELDTGHCFMGQERFAVLHAMAPADCTLVGIDEHTTLFVSFEQETCWTAGQGTVHLLRGGRQLDYPSGSSFPIQALGDYRPLLDPTSGLLETVWAAALSAEADRQAAARPLDQDEAPEEIRRLVSQRQEARLAKDWGRADDLRQQLERLGWTVQDTSTGPLLTRKS